MSFSAVPTAVFAGWSEDGTNITVPIASIPELTAAEADAATGDSRKVLFALCSQIYAWYNALAAADRPTKVTVTKAVSTNTATGLTTQVFTLTFVTAITSQDVVAE